MVVVDGSGVWEMEDTFRASKGEELGSSARGSPSQGHGMRGGIHFALALALILTRKVLEKGFIGEYLSPLR